MKNRVLLTAGLLIAVLGIAGCKARGEVFTVGLYEKISSLDPIRAVEVKASSERVRVLLFNSLVKKNERFEYVPDLASKIEPSADGLTYTFTLRPNITFHDGRPFTSGDAKYSLDTLMASSSGKAASFFESVNGAKQPLISAVEAPSPETLIIRLAKPWQPLLSNLVPIGMIPAGSADSQVEHPVGTGPYKFISYNQAQSVLDLESNENYWEGPPNVKKLRVRAVEDANALQAELKSGRVDMAPMATNLSADAIKGLGEQPNLKVDKFPGANLVYLNFNTESAPLDNAAVRQAIAYSIDRQKLVDGLLLGQARVAHSILPEGSWAYAPGQKYGYDPTKARQLLDEAGFRDPDGDGPQMRLAKPLIYTISSSSSAARQYAGVIQDFLKQVGIPVEIQTVETAILIEQQTKGQFQMASGSWVGGNQDPIFLKDLFASSEVPTAGRLGRNRSRYTNREFDQIINEAINTTDRERALGLYARAQEILSRDMPMLPLWYPDNIVVAKKNISNIKVDPGGDWGFIRAIRVD